jgi:hypothetical protein
LAHIAELLSQFQQADLGPDHLLCLRHRGLSDISAYETDWVS